MLNTIKDTLKNIQNKKVQAWVKSLETMYGEFWTWGQRVGSHSAPKLPQSSGKEKDVRVEPVATNPASNPEEEVVKEHLIFFL